VLEEAVEYELLDMNPARGKRRRMKVAKSRRTFLEPSMVIDLLDVAGEWEASLPEHQRYGRRAFLATLCLAGPRISELTGARLGSLDIHGGRLRVEDSKTDAGHRDIELTAFLAGELRAHLASIDPRAACPVRSAAPDLPHAQGRPVERVERPQPAPERHARRRTARPGSRGPCSAPTNGARSAARCCCPPPWGPHALRRTFASLHIAAGRDTPWVAKQMGHTDHRMTLNVYAQVMARTQQDKATIWELMRFPSEQDRETIDTEVKGEA
jgi:integrase